MKRRSFIFDIFSVGIVSAMSTKLRAVNLNFTPMVRSISTWKTTEANQKAGQMLEKGENALDAAIAGAFAKKKPIFTYYWAPTGLMGKVDLVRLSEPKFDADCWNKMSVVVEDIKANGPDAYKKSCACEYRDMALTKSVLTDWAKAHPAETEFLKKYTIPTATVNKMLAFYEDESGGDMEATAIEFLKTETMWKDWVPADVAKKVSAAL